MDNNSNKYIQTQNQNNFDQDNNVENWQEEQNFEIEIQETKKFKWESWPSQTKLYCHGKLWTGNPKDRLSQLISLFGFFVLILHFYYFIIEYYQNELQVNILNYVFWMFSPLTLLFLVLCFITEPGVILRGNIAPPPQQEDKQKKKNDLQKELSINNNIQDHEQYNENGLKTIEISMENLDEKNNFNDDDKNYIHKQYKLDITFYKERYCTTCKIMRPSKTSHCSRCDQCVKYFDHHCFFIGNCVGIRNIRYFVGFLGFGMIYCWIAIISSLYITYHLSFVQTQQNSFFKKIQDNSYLYYPLLTLSIIYILVNCCGLRLSKKFSAFISQCCLLFFVISLVILNDWNQPYRKNIICSLFQALITQIANGVLAPMGCSTFWNVTRAITEKERVVIENQIQYNFQGFKISTKQIIRNIKEFFTFKIPQSELLDN